MVAFNITIMEITIRSITAAFKSETRQAIQRTLGLLLTLEAIQVAAQRHRQILSLPERNF